jgi:hypothetical protein
VHYAEIPNTSYGLACCGSTDPTDTYEAWEFIFLQDVTSPFSEKYTVQVIGRARGVYGGQIGLSQTRAKSTNGFALKGVIDSSQSIFYKIPYTTDSTQSPSVTKVVDTTVLRQDLDNCQKLNLLRDASLYQGLTTEVKKIDSLLALRDTVKTRYELLQFDILIDRATGDTLRIIPDGYQILKEDIILLFSQMPPGTAPSTPVPSYTLNQGVTGSGTITLNPNKTYYDSASSVQLTAAAAAGYSFSNWTGDINSSVNPLTLTMNSNKNITANFLLNSYTITASAGSNGSISPSDAVVLSYGANQTYTFTPNESYHVDSVIVDGVNQGPSTSYTFTGVSSNHTIRATFAINQYTLTIIISGVSYCGTVTKYPNQTTYAAGTSVKLTARGRGGDSLANCAFDHWEMDATGTANPITIIMNSNKTVKAVFIAI